MMPTELTITKFLAAIAAWIFLINPTSAAIETNFNQPIVTGAVPEPGVIALFMVGAIVLVVHRLRRRRVAT